MVSGRYSSASASLEAISARASSDPHPPVLDPGGKRCKRDAALSAQKEIDQLQGNRPGVHSHSQRITTWDIGIAGVVCSCRTAGTRFGKADVSRREDDE